MAVLFLLRRSLFLQRHHVRCLQSFWTFDQVEFDLRAFGQRAKAFGLNCAEVNEDVLSALGRDKAEALRVVEPLYSTVVTHFR